MRILWLLIPGFFVGVLIADSFRKIWSDDDRLIRKLLADQPATMGATATAIGSVFVWAVLKLLGLW